MEQFTEVVKHLQAAYIAGTGNPNIGPADGRMSRIGALIVELGGTQAFFEAQRQANVQRENSPQTPQKKSPLTPMERKPSARLMDASANPVLQNMSGKAGVAGNPDKPLSNAKQVEVPKHDLLNPSGEYIPTDIVMGKNPKWMKGESGGIGKLTFKEVDFSSDMEDFDKEREAMQLTETPGEIAMLESEFEENTRLLTEVDYKGKTPKYVAENYSLEQIEETLKSLGIGFGPAMSVKQKAAHLVKSIK